MRRLFACCLLALLLAAPACGEDDAAAGGFDPALGFSASVPPSVAPPPTASLSNWPAPVPSMSISSVPPAPWL